ncbi:MAG: glycosyltransferase family 2 protein [Gammaproteobacteria bacterium]|nr:glycosyltransferase family 2 protein [Gammaproteobacteria bacterium]
MHPSQRQVALHNKSVFISCIIPVFNEADNIQLFIEHLNEMLKTLSHSYEMILVDDGSTDESVAKIRQLASLYPLKLLGLSRNFGKEIALTAGLEHAHGQVAILIDGDFQHPIALLPEFLNQWGLGYDMVYGLRQDRAGESYFKRQFAHLFYWLMRKIAQVDIPNNAGDFRLIDKKIMAALSTFPERTRFMKGLYAWVGYKKMGIPYEVQARRGGQSGWGLRSLAELALTGITSFSNVPLRVWGFIGSIISFISLLYAIYMVTVTLIYGADLPGFPTLIVAIMFLGGIQLLSIGILGEYIARIFTEVKQRPKYLLEVKEGFDEK